MSPKQKSLTLNAIMNMINQVSAVLFPLITFPYVSRILRPEGLGKVNFAMAIVGFFVMIASLGIPMYGTREVAKVRDNKQNLSQLVAELFVLNMVMTVVGFIAFGLFMLFSEKAASDPLLFWICTLPMLLAPVGFSYLFQGVEEFTYVTMRTIAFRMLSLIAMFLFIHKSSDYWIYALITGLNTAGANLINLFFARKHLSFRLVEFKALKVTKHFKPVLIIFSLGLALSIYTSLDKVMLGYMCDAQSVGNYAAALRIMNVGKAFITCIGIVMIPRLAYMVQYADTDAFVHKALQSLEVYWLLAMPLSVGIFMLAEPVVLLICGKAFQSSILPLRLLVLGIPFIVYNHFVGLQLFFPYNKEKFVLLSVCTGALLNLVLNWYLIPFWGVLGACLSTLLARVAVAVMNLIQSRKVVYVPIRRSGLPIYLVGSLIAYFIADITEHLFLMPDIWVSVFKGMCFSSIYFLFVVCWQRPVVVSLIKKVRLVF